MNAIRHRDMSRAEIKVALQRILIAVLSFQSTLTSIKKAIDECSLFTVHCSLFHFFTCSLLFRRNWQNRRTRRALRLGLRFHLADQHGRGHRAYWDRAWLRGALP